MSSNTSEDDNDGYSDTDIRELKEASREINYVVTVK